MLLEALVLSVSILGTALAQERSSPPDVVTVLNDTLGFSYLNTYLNTFPAVKDSLVDLKNVTFLAPSDNALAKFFEDTERYEALATSGASFLENLIRYHILEGVQDNITTWTPQRTLLTSPDYTNVTGGQVMFTVYDNHGFQNTFYSGQELIGGSCRESIPFEGGVIYPIDAVLNIPGPVEKEVGGYKEGTLFIEALERAGLLGQVQQMKDVTFLVPNNTAYQLVEESLNALSAEDLADVLKYHIIPDKIGYYGDVEDGTKMKTLQGQEVTFGVRNNRYSAFVDGAMLYYVDTPVANGLLHTLDQVLNPKAAIAPPAEAESGVPAFQTNAISTTTGGNNSASTTASATPEAYTGAAGMSIPKVGTISLVSIVGAVAWAISV